MKTSLCAMRKDFFFFLICFVVVLITEHEDFHRRLWMAVVWLVI